MKTRTLALGLFGLGATLASIGCDTGLSIRGTLPIPVRAARPPEVVDTPPPEKKPSVVVTDVDLQIPEKILFATGRADILPGSHGLLNEIAQVILKNPQLTKLEIAGHTDDQGSAPFNLALSQSRAKSVWSYLVKAGVDPARLVHKGYGKTRPLATNATAEGREKNRRVEFVILEQTRRKP